MSKESDKIQLPGPDKLIEMALPDLGEGLVEALKLITSGREVGFALLVMGVEEGQTQYTANISKEILFASIKSLLEEEDESTKIILLN